MRKRAIGVMIGAVAFMLATSLAALAQSGLDEPGGGAVAGSGGSAGTDTGGVAFTGGEVTGLVVVAVVLALTGAFLIVRARRRPAVPAES